MQDLAKGIELASRFTLVRKLGAGGAAETWLATDRLTRASVALKILINENISAAEFHKEWQTSIRLMHAHIVRVFEFNDDAGSVFYSLQFIDGPDISVLSGAPLEQTLPPIALLADALRYAHGKGVVHRDIKPGNVLIDHNGAPYLIDFGVSAIRKPGFHPINHFLHSFLQQLDLNAWVKHKNKGRMESLSAEDARYYRPMRIDRTARILKRGWIRFKRSAMAMKASW